MLCQLSYSHRRFDYSNCASHMSETVAAVEPSIANRIATVGSSIDRAPVQHFRFLCDDDLGFDPSFSQSEKRWQGI